MCPIFTQLLQYGLSAGLASVITQTAVFFTMLFGVLFFKEKLNAPLVVGTLIAFCGVALIFFYTDGSTTVLGLSLGLGGAMGWALANVVVKKSEATDMFGFMIWSSVVAPLPLLALSLAFSGSEGIRASITHFDLIALASLLFQVYPTTLLGYSIWNHLLSKYSVSTVAPLALLVPVFGMLGSVIRDLCITYCAAEFWSCDARCTVVQVRFSNQTSTARYSCAEVSILFKGGLPDYKLATIDLIFYGLLVHRFGGRFFSAGLS